VTPAMNRFANNFGRDKEALDMPANSCRDLGREGLSLLTAQQKLRPLPFTNNSATNTLVGIVKDDILSRSEVNVLAIQWNIIFGAICHPSRSMGRSQLWDPVDASC
jgi:hypothetical protein